MFQLELDQLSPDRQNGNKTHLADSKSVQRKSKLSTFHSLILHSSDDSNNLQIWAPFSALKGPKVVGINLNHIV